MAGRFAVFAYISIPFCFIGIVGNLVVLAAIFTSPLRKSHSLIMVISLVIDNLLRSILAQPHSAYSSIRGVNGLDEGSCKFFAFCVVFLDYVGCSHQAAIAVNRFLAIVCLNKLSQTWHNRLIYILLCFTWLTPLLVFILPFFEIGANYGFSKLFQRCIFTKQSYDFILAYRILFQVLPFVIMGICYLPILIKIKNVRQTVEAGTSAAGVKIAKRFATQVQITKNTAILALFYLVCFMPSTIWNFVVGDLNHDPIENLGPSLFLMLWIGNVHEPRQN